MITGASNVSHFDSMCERLGPVATNSILDSKSTTIRPSSSRQYNNKSTAGNLNNAKPYPTLDRFEILRLKFKLLSSSKFSNVEMDISAFKNVVEQRGEDNLMERQSNDELRYHTYERCKAYIDRLILISPELKDVLNLETHLNAIHILCNAPLQKNGDKLTENVGVCVDQDEKTKSSFVPFHKSIAINLSDILNNINKLFEKCEKIQCENQKLRRARKAHAIKSIPMEVIPEEQ